MQIAKDVWIRKDDSHKFCWIALSASSNVWNTETVKPEKLLRYPFALDTRALEHRIVTQQDKYTWRGIRSWTLTVSNHREKSLVWFSHMPVLGEQRSSSAGTQFHDCT